MKLFFDYVSLAFRLSLLTSLLFRTVNAQCYWPDGTPDSAPRADYVACNGGSSDGFSACCNVNDTCTTNGFCKYNGLKDTNFLWRNACSDPTWKSPNCAQRCTIDPKTGKPYNKSRLVQACSQTTYCCFPDVDFSIGYIFRDNFAGISCCDDPSQIFDDGPADFLSGIRYFTTSLFPVTMTTSTKTQMVPSSTSTTPTTSSASTSIISSAPPPSGAYTVTSVRLAPSGESDASGGSATYANPAQSSDLSLGAKAGIGIGAAFVAVFAIAVAAWLIMKSRQHQQMTRRPIISPPYPIEADKMDWQTAAAFGFAFQTVELPSEGRMELPTNGPTELPSKHYPMWSELPSKYCASPKELP